MRKSLYKTDSDFQFYKLVIGRIAIIIAIVAAFLNIRENPVVITIGIIVLALIFLISGNESITVYNDSFIYNYGGILKLFSKKTFYYKDLKGVSCEGIFGYGIDKVTDNLKLPNVDNSIDIAFKNGETETLRSKIYEDGIREAVSFINLQLKRYSTN